MIVVKAWAIWMELCPPRANKAACPIHTVQNEAEASTLLSALRCALDTCGLPWPVLLPVHDALRDAYWGAASVPASVAATLPALTKAPGHVGIPGAAGPGPGAGAGGSSALQPMCSASGGRSIRFSTDSVHISSLPEALTTLQVGPWVGARALGVSRSHISGHAPLL